MGCRSGEDSGKGQAASATSVALQPGHHWATTGGWQVELPDSFRPAPAPEGVENGAMLWLIHERGPKGKGSPYVVLAVHAKPATFPSRVFGLTALEALRTQAPQKVILRERQHSPPLGAGSDVVTDIELRLTTATRTTREWRRLFVADGRAYILTFGAEESEAQSWASTAEAVLNSLSSTER